jgi:ABC-2 type transport system permease protein
MKELRLAAKIIKTLTKDRLHYPDRLLLDTIGLIARCGILLVLYYYVFKLNNGTINNTTFVFAAWSVFLYFIFSVMRLRDISRMIMQDVQSGNVEILMNRPISYLSYRMWWQIGSGFYSFAIISVLATIVMIIFVGLPKTMLSAIFLSTLVLTFIFSVILSLILYSLVGLSAFWIEDANPVFWLVDKAVMILGGSYLPVALFPPLMYQLAIYSPFGACQFIVHTVYESWGNDWYWLIGIQLLWIAIAGAVMALVFSRAKRKISINGG